MPVADLSLAPYIEVSRNLPWLLPVLVGILGACIGSFLNVVIYRVPAGKSVVFPGSTCGCGKPIAWHDNIPVFSWLWLRGRARCCGRSFSPRYCLVEAFTAAVFVLCWLRFSPGVAFTGMVFASFLIAGSFIDIDHMVIPDTCTLGLGGLGLVLSFLFPALHHISTGTPSVDSMQSLVVSLRGMFIGSGLVLWLVLALEAVLKKDAMGFGDVKLLGAIGAFCGWAGAAFALGAGAVIGLVWVLLSVAWQRITGRKSALAPMAQTDDGQPTELGRGAQIPFGPSLALAGLIYFLYARPIVEAYIPRL